jgi:hypothetical protein
MIRTRDKPCLLNKRRHMHRLHLDEIRGPMRGQFLMPGYDLFKRDMHSRRPWGLRPRWR